MKVICPFFLDCKYKNNDHCILHEKQDDCNRNCTGNGQFLHSKKILACIEPDKKNESYISSKKTRIEVICPDFYNCKKIGGCSHRSRHRKDDNACIPNCVHGNETHSEKPCSIITKKINALIVLKRLQ